MGILDRLFGKKEEKETESKEEDSDSEQGKYSEECSLCGATGTEKKWMGKYWHKKCIRVAKKGARKMI